jgi:hypothetical protein
VAYHFVLTYSNWEDFTLCFSESFESFSLGFQNALGQLGGAPWHHRSDRMTLAVNPSANPERFTGPYRALLDHYGIRPQTIQAGHGNENGDAEQSHHRFKTAVDQALLLRGSRDFDDRASYEAFLRAVCAQNNSARAARLAEERPLLRPLPACRLDAGKRVRVRVGPGSTIRVERSTYSVPARLIGEWVEAHVEAEAIAVRYAGRPVETLPRLRGRHKHRIDYRHVIDWLVRKPGAFAQYKYQADLFPTSRFRQAYDGWLAQRPERASREYLALLHLAAREGEALVDGVLGELLLGEGAVSAEAVRARLGTVESSPRVPEVAVGPVDLAVYDELLLVKEEGDERGQGREGEPGGAPQGAAPADDAGGAGGGGAAGAAGGPQLRAVPPGPDAARVSGAPAEAHAAAAAREPAAVGEDAASL